MTTERRRQITEVFEGALAREPAARGAFIDEACSGDTSLRAEVHALLTAQETTAVPTREGPRPPAQIAATPASRKLGHYRILERIGAGGMGEVYRAHDDDLRRDVAVKILPGRALGDGAARTRLLREARVAAALNHPNICTIHEVGEAEGQVYIAMELIEGEPLSTRLGGGPLLPSEVVRLALPLADAVAHAHERGVVHRDLKSANVIVTPTGWPKVLDFGLARRLATEDMEEATRSQSLTEPGKIAGTLAYMPPEQLRGQPADARGDIWSLGVVMYEMTAGERPFHGRTAFELVSSVLNEAPRPLPPQVPAELQAVIDRCLDKEPARRYHTASELRAALEAVQGGTALAARRSAVPRRRRFVVAAAALVLAAVVAAVAVGRARPFGGAARIESLAVLPLENLSGDAAQAYFADGMTEALITDLTRLQGIKRVIARASVMRYKGTNKPLPEIARELKVSAVITGAVLRSGDRVRVTAQLIDPTTEEQLWADRYERDLRDVLALQNDITRAIASEIKAKLTPGEQARLASARRVDPEAYEAYLNGRFHNNKMSVQAFNTALEYYQLALQKDPDYALAHYGVGWVWVGRAHMGATPPQEALQKAKVEFLKAIQLDDTLAEAHSGLASVAAIGDWDWSTADREYRRAFQVNPNFHEPSQGPVDILLMQGRRDDALAELRRGVDSDPLNSFLLTAVGGRMLRLGRWDEGVEVLRKAVATEPNIPFAHRYLWTAFDQRRMYDHAVVEAKTFWTLSGQAEIAEALPADYEARGYQWAMKRAADKLAERAKGMYIQPTQIAAMYAHAGEKDLSLEWLERAYDIRDTWLIFLRDDPRFDPLRADGRFQELVRRMRFPA